VENAERTAAWSGSFRHADPTAPRRKSAEMEAKLPHESSRAAR